MKEFFDFIWYCTQSMFAGFSALIGHVPEGFTWKEALAGGITFLVIIALLILIAWSLSIITFDKKIDLKK